MEDYLIDTKRAADQIGISVQYLHVWLSRHPECRPNRFLKGSYQWSQAQIAKVIEQRRYDRRRSKAKHSQ